MRKPRPALVISVTVPFLIGCFGIQVRPLPEPQARRSVDIRGVVLRNGGDGERVEFERMDHAEWSDSTVALTGVLKAGETRTGNAPPAGAVTTRSFPFTAISGVLVRQLDANRTSIVIAAVGVGAIALAAFALTGKTDETTVLGVTGRN